MAQYPGQANFLAVVDDDTAEFARHIPDELRTRGLYLAHRRPLVGVPAVPGEDKPIKSFRIGPEKAWQFHRLEINPAHCWCVMVFDCDVGPRADAVLPSPTWRVVNGENGHEQWAYILQMPVHRSKSSGKHPQDYASAVYAGMVELLRADVGYNGVLARNPCKPGPRCDTEWNSSPWGWTLGELAEYVRLPPYIPHHKPHSGYDGDGNPLPLLDAYRVGHIGRNVYLFRWALPRAFSLLRLHGASRLPDTVQELLDGENWRRFAIRDFLAPLPDAEIGYIAKSIAKITTANYDAGRFAAVQSERGIASGKARRQRNLERDLAIRYAYHEAGYTQQEVAGMFGLTQPAVHYILRRVM